MNRDQKYQKHASVPGIPVSFAQKFFFSRPGVSRSNEILFFVSDLHGRRDRYEKLFLRIREERPSALFIGGDILPHFARLTSNEDFIADYLIPQFRDLKLRMRETYPAVFIILGNDDPRVEEEGLEEGEAEGLWRYMHGRKASFGAFTVYGYSCIPPSPFRLKDWERYDVSRYVDPGCYPPEEGVHSTDTGEDLEYATIQKDLAALAGADDLSRAIFLFHVPPYKSLLDRAALDGLMVDHVPVDVHIGSIAVRRFIEERRPFLTLHGHVHESSRLTGHWYERIGATHAFNAALEPPDLSLVRLNSADPGASERVLL